MTKFDPRTRTFRVVSVLLLVLIVPFAIWQYSRYLRIEAVSGIYLINGGRSLVVLDRGFGNGLDWTKGRLHTTSYIAGKSPTEFHLNANLTGDAISLHQTEVGSNLYEPGKSLIDLSLNFVPSSTLEGDWDLSGGKLTLYTSTSTAAKSLREQATYYIRKIFLTWGEPDMVMMLDETGQLLPSYLHRIDDPRILEYFELRSEGRFDKNNLEDFRAILADHPEDLFLQLHQIDVEATYGDLVRAKSIMAVWKDRHWERADKVLRESAVIAFKSVAIAESLPEGDDLSGVILSFIGPENNLDTRLDQVREFLKYKQAIGAIVPLVEPSHDLSSTFGALPNYLDLQINARVIRTLAILQLFKGKNIESIETLAGLYHQGQILNASGWVIQRLIGIAIHLIAYDGLKFAILNAIHTEEEALRAKEIIDQLENLEGKETGETLLRDEWMAPVRYMDPASGGLLPNTLELKIRHRVGQAYLQLLRVVMAIKLHMIRTDAFPRDKNSIEQILGTPFPSDPFGEGGISMVQPSPETLMVYSIGPNEIDEGGDIPYAPTNGTKSIGDIVVNIPTQREYPFPTGGVRADSPEEILKQFPQGLPGDRFALKGFPYRGDLSLGIYDRSGSNPMRVFSYGPDGIEPHSYQRIIHYEMPGMNALASDESTPHSLQPVYTPPTQPGGAPVSYDPLIPYEPTNGIKSSGDLFVEIEEE